MSHTVTVKVEMKDTSAIGSAVDRIEGAHFIKPAVRDVRKRDEAPNIQEATGRHGIYSGAFEGIGVQLPGWNYPIVINPETGEVKYDNFSGSWGSQERLDEMVQMYSVEKAKAEAVLHGLTASEEALDNGDIKLTINDYRQ